MKLLHLADTHFKVANLAQYRPVLDRICSDAERLFEEKEELVIVIAGDVLDAYTNVHMDIAFTVSEFLLRLLRCGDVVVVPGNHDFNPSALSVDSLGNILEHVQKTNSSAHELHYFCKTGVYGVRGVHFAVCSLRDTPSFIRYAEARECVGDERIVCIFHGIVGGVSGDRALESAQRNQQRSSAARTVRKSDFLGYAAVLMGDIHKHQSWKIDGNPGSGSMVYCGSPMQLNFGEDNCHGYVLWDYGEESITWRFHEVPNEHEMVSLDFVRRREAVESRLSCIKGTRIALRVLYERPEDLEWAQAVVGASRQIYSEDFRQMSSVSSIVEQKAVVEYSAEQLFNDRLDAELQFIQNLRKDGVWDPSFNERMTSFHRAYCKDVAFEAPKKYTLDRMEVEGFLSYKNRTVFDFHDWGQTIVVQGSNGHGKSSIMKAFLFLFTKLNGIESRNKTNPIINFQTKTFSISLNFVDDSKEKYLFKRESEKDKKDAKLNKVKTTLLTNKANVRSVDFTEYGDMTEFLTAYAGGSLTEKSLKPLLKGCTSSGHIKAARDAADKRSKVLRAELNVREKAFNELRGYVAALSKTVESSSSSSMDLDGAERRLEEVRRRLSALLSCYVEVPPQVAALLGPRAAERGAEWVAQAVAFFEENASKLHALVGRELRQLGREYAVVIRCAVPQAPPVPFVLQQFAQEASRLPRKVLRSKDIQMLLESCRVRAERVSRARVQLQLAVQAREMALACIVVEPLECCPKERGVQELQVALQRAQWEWSEAARAVGGEVQDVELPKPLQTKRYGFSEELLSREDAAALWKRLDGYEMDDAGHASPRRFLWCLEHLDELEEAFGEYVDACEALEERESHVSAEQEACIGALQEAMSRQLPTLRQWRAIRTLLDSEENLRALLYSMRENNALQHEEKKKAAEKKAVLFIQFKNTLQMLINERCALQRREEYEQYVQRKLVEKEMLEEARLLAGQLRAACARDVQAAEEQLRELEVAEPWNIQSLELCLKLAKDTGVYDPRKLGMRVRVAEFEPAYARVAARWCAEDEERAEEYRAAEFLRECRAALAGLPEHMAAVGAEVRALQKEAEVLSRDVAVERDRRARVEETLRELEQSRERCAKAEVLRGETEEQLNGLEDYRKHVLGNKEFESCGYVAFVKRVSDEVNVLLDGVVGYRFKMEADTAGEVSMRVVDPRHPEREMFYTALSGYETTVCEIALRAAVQRVGLLDKFDILFIDDSVQKVHADNIESFATLLQKLGAYYSKIVVITHNALLQNIGDTFVHVHKTSDGSHIEVRRPGT